MQIEHQTRVIVDDYGQVLYLKAPGRDCFPDDFGNLVDNGWSGLLGIDDLELGCPDAVGSDHVSGTPTCTTGAF